MMIPSKRIAFGIQEPLPLVGFPPGRIKIRMRADKCVSIYVKTEDWIKEFRAEVKDGNWVAFGPIGENRRVNQ